MIQYLLGIDIGTSACKVAIFDVRGKVIGSDSGSYNVYYPHKGWVEQEPEEWWQVVGKTVKRVLEKSHIPARKIAGVGIDGQSGSAIAMSKEGEVLTRNPIWMDTRTAAICEELNKTIGEKKIFNLAGNSLQPTYSTAKILWYKKNLPEMFKNIDKILQSNSFIAYKLTGKLTQDLSQGYGLHCFDMREGKWDEAMCEELGIPVHLLPNIYPCHEVIGTVTEKAAQETGLMEGTPVIAGGLDAACGTLGAGVIDAGQTQEQGGQAGGMSICMDEYRADSRLMLSFHVVPNRWLLQGGTTGGGGVMRWLEQEFGAYERQMESEGRGSSLEQFNRLAEKVNAGSDGLVFLPYMQGERSPIWNPHARGVYYGLDFSKTKGHFIRAAMEGVAFALKHNLDIAESTGAKVSDLRAMGGSANSLLWTQIKSDITGKVIYVPSSDTATTLGAAILAGVGIGIYKNFEEAVSMTVENKRYHCPNQETEFVYKENYKLYLSLYEHLKEVMK